MSTTTTLPPLPPIGRSVRAYFAPVDRVHKTPTLFDPSVNGRFSVNTPPAPWISLGWIENFARKSASKFGDLVTGTPGATQMQVRATVDATVAFRFKTWTKLSMALAAGSQHMNLLVPAAGGAANGSGSKGVPPVNLATGSTAAFLALSATDAATFSAGSLVTVDVDYASTTGFVGSGVYAAYVSSAAAVNSDPDYIRRVSFNVARVASVSTGSTPGLQLAQPLLAGVPAAGMRVQPLSGFVDREGGSFFQEWSALFVVDGQQGERILYHYPRLQSMAGPAEESSALAPPLERLALGASFRALPVTDANDGETVVCFRSFLPSPMTLI
ncbi:MAG TPA: hypothetical protein VHU89_10520 [Acidobacteriaceae bacterium]|jgi:hypothetical protein|nr:hypothetical protein [Acidobacteriaceae bacterium]